ncbi:hypothetical protein E6O75_ATG04023 [Venturia nashicola]|uniref:Uncharacterized protein n=1 Tax=Venturia nashicola TaxID=86259 RepID=A0A4Z1P9H8_9PEZI|nr:hypothetical protein E6O75_ATG04023 [Venturia nashicola]
MDDQRCQHSRRGFSSTSMENVVLRVSKSEHKVGNSAIEAGVSLGLKTLRMSESLELSTQYTRHRQPCDMGAEPRTKINPRDANCTV